MEEYQYTAKIYDPLLSPFMRPIRNKITALVKQYRYKSILDVCCGTGEQLKLLKKHGFEGEGVDLSDAMLRVALQGKDTVLCKREDATQMQYEHDKFDLVMTTFALHEKNHSSARSIVKEMVRVAVEGGDILIVDYELSEKTSLFSKSLIYLIEWIAGGEHYRNFKSYIKKGGLSTLLSGVELTEERRYYFGKHGIVMVLLRKSSL